MQLRTLDTTRKRDVRQFIQFPFDLYRGCPYWVPPLVSDLELALNRQKHPFYRHSTADFLVVERDGKTMGRIAVGENCPFNEYQHRKAAFFNYVDFVDDASVSRALFDAAFDWARGRGLNQIIGPKGLLVLEGSGILVEGFDHRPSMTMTYNYPYYDGLIRAAGFEVYGDSFSGYLPGSYDLPARYYELAEKVKARRGLWVKNFSSKQEALHWVPSIIQAFEVGFAENWDYHPSSKEEMDMMVRQLLDVADPRLIKLVMKGDGIIGFVFAFPDLTAALQRARGRLWPLGWYHLLREFKRTQWVDLNGIAILPAHRGVGANVLLYTELARTVHEYGFKHADIVQVGAENEKSLAEMRALGVQWYKRHRCYRRTL
jgi:GNAT superfamily N-acetyltransferase